MRRTLPGIRITRRLAELAIAAVTLLTGTGCLRHFQSAHTCASDLDCPPPALPRCCQEKVHIFIFHGTDPLDLANLHGLRGRCVELGYPHATLGQCFHAKLFREKIKAIRAADPDARFVILGFSAGANAACHMVNRLHDDDGIDVDLLIYMGGNTLKDRPTTRPPSTGKVVNILAHGWIWNGCDLHDAENIHYADVWHFGSPRHPATLALLDRELREVAQRVPRIEYHPPSVGEAAITPRPVVSDFHEPADEWDFLKPTDSLRSTGEMRSYPLGVEVRRAAKPKH